MHLEWRTAPSQRMTRRVPAGKRAVEAVTRDRDCRFMVGTMKETSALQIAATATAAGDGGLPSRPGPAPGGRGVAFTIEQCAPPARVCTP